MQIEDHWLTHFSLTVCNPKTLEFDGLQTKNGLSLTLCNPTSLELDGLQPEITY